MKSKNSQNPVRVVHWLILGGLQDSKMYPSPWRVRFHMECCHVTVSGHRIGLMKPKAKKPPNPAEVNSLPEKVDKECSFELTSKFNWFSNKRGEFSSKNKSVLSNIICN